MSENFRRRMENTQEDVIVALNTGLQERKIRNLAVLKTIVKTVFLCDLIVTANCSLLAVSRTSSADNENHPPASLQSFTILLWILSPMIEITSFCVVLVVY
jgi:hypothetical protein